MFVFSFPSRIMGGDMLLKDCGEFQRPWTVWRRNSGVMKEVTWMSWHLGNHFSLGAHQIIRLGRIEIVTREREHQFIVAGSPFTLGYGDRTDRPFVDGHRSVYVVSFV